jgi:hypothetical protein
MIAAEGSRRKVCSDANIVCPSTTRCACASETVMLPTGCLRLLRLHVLWHALDHERLSPRQPVASEHF